MNGPSLRDPMEATLNMPEAVRPLTDGAGLPTASQRAASCAHCGLACAAGAPADHGRCFCCQGCQIVFELLRRNGLGEFYTLGAETGLKIQRPAEPAEYAWLDEPAVRERLVEFTNERATRVTFRVPAIHCLACVWLLENLHRLQAGIGRVLVNFPRREVTILFDPRQVRLGAVATLLASLGYEPDFKYADLESRRDTPVSRRLWLQLGVAGFAFGNIMLFSLPGYFGLDAFSGPQFARLFGWFSLALSVPVLFFSAADYWRAAWASLRQRRLALEVPIALGLLALVVQSGYEVVGGHGEGYFDSLTGLLFFLLLGRVFQQKAYERLSFDRDYRSFFPLTVLRRRDGGERRVALSELAAGDRLVIRNGELIPADARLISGTALVDYSFVTGESEPVAHEIGDRVQAGGRQSGGAIEIEMVKPVSQSYLTSLWSQAVFRKDGRAGYVTLTNRLSPWFTTVVICLAAGSAVAWADTDPGKAVRAFTAVLIVACPCALALAAPFALGTAQRALGRRGVFLKHPETLEQLARVDTVVFDKTGTLTEGGRGAVSFVGTPLSDSEERAVLSIVRHSAHPLAARLTAHFQARQHSETVSRFLEVVGRGVEGRVNGREVRLGSVEWLAACGVAVGYASSAVGATDSASSVHLAVDGDCRGCFRLAGGLRPAIDGLLARLAGRVQLALLSGDQDCERARYATLLPGAELRFGQSPLDKLEYIRGLKAQGRTVLMVGDGLNDAGALRQSDVGVAVVEESGTFSPASDVILEARQLVQLDRLLAHARSAVRVVRLCLVVSLCYNVVGVTIAARGLMSPVICAILMPLSSVTVAALAAGLSAWVGRRQWKESR